jgi:hypothetical protein
MRNLAGWKPALCDAYSKSVSKIKDNRAQVAAAAFLFPFFASFFPFSFVEGVEKWESGKFGCQKLGIGFEGRR